MTGVAGGELTLWPSTKDSAPLDLAETCRGIGSMYAPLYGHRVALGKRTFALGGIVLQAHMEVSV